MCDTVIRRVNCWVQRFSPHSPPLSPIHLSIHLYLYPPPPPPPPPRSFKSFSLCLILFVLCFPSTKSAAGGEAQKRLSTNSFVVFCRQCSAFEFRSASTAHTWFGIGSRAGAKPTASEGSEGWGVRFWDEREERGRCSVMKGDTARRCGWGGCARDAVVTWYSRNSYC